MAAQRAQREEVLVMRLGVATHWIGAALFAGAALGCGSSGSGRAAPGADSGAPTVGGAVHVVTPDGYKVCARLDDAVDCFACCASFFPVAQQKVMNAAAACTCTPTYCGPRSGLSAEAGDEGGAPDLMDDAEADGTAGFEGGDDAPLATEAGGPTPARTDADTGFPFGLGSCSADMCSLQTAPSQLCVKCTLGVLTGSEGLPLCAESAAACNADPDCAPILTCGAYCPAAVPD